MDARAAAGAGREPARRVRLPFLSLVAKFGADRLRFGSGIIRNVLAHGCLRQEVDIKRLALLVRNASYSPKVVDSQQLLVGIWLLMRLWRWLAGLQRVDAALQGAASHGARLPQRQGTRRSIRRAS